MCNKSLEIATTTAYATTVPATTTTHPTTTELPYIEPTTTSTATEIVSTTTESPAPVTTTATTTTLFLSHQTTTVGPVKYPPPLSNNTIEIIERTIYSTDGSALNIVAIIVSCLALLGCIGAIIYTHIKHEALKKRKMVRPSQVSIDISKTPKIKLKTVAKMATSNVPLSAQPRGQPNPHTQRHVVPRGEAPPRGQPNPHQQPRGHTQRHVVPRGEAPPRGQPRPLQPPQVTPHLPPKPNRKPPTTFAEKRDVFEKTSIKDTSGTLK